MSTPVEPPVVTWAAWMASFWSDPDFVVAITSLLLTYSPRPCRRETRIVVDLLVDLSRDGRLADVGAGAEAVGAAVEGDQLERPSPSFRVKDASFVRWKFLVRVCSVPTMDALDEPSVASVPDAVMPVAARRRPPPGCCWRWWWCRGRGRRCRMWPRAWARRRRFHGVRLHLKLVALERDGGLDAGSVQLRLDGFGDLGLRGRGAQRGTGLV